MPRKTPAAPITNANIISTFDGFHKHPELEGKHAFLSPSNHSWQRYSKEHLLSVYENELNKERGTRIHAFVSESIKLGFKLGESTTAIAQFVNDAIGFRMQSEVPLYYSHYVFGTADAIRFDEATMTLRIHDLKTGGRPVRTFEQLDAYAALFLLEYGYAPQQVTIIQRLYQAGTFTEQIADTESIAALMSTMMDFTTALSDESQQFLQEG